MEQQQEQQAQSFTQPEPEAPNVKFIECSCAAADSRNSDNSTWTNIIREPIEVAKGSEIKIQTNFIDMRGIDAEIIQFQLNGPKQDNSHTMLTQLYSCNDGCNSKTTSYDYISSTDVPLVVDPGQDYGGTDVTTDAVNWRTDGDGIGFTGGATAGFVMKHYAHSVRPQNVSVYAAGSGYTNGSGFKCLAQGSATEFYTGKILTDSGGVVKQVVMTMPCAAAGPPTLVGPAPSYWDITFDEAQRGTGLEIISTNTSNGLFYESINGIHNSNADRGTKFKVGDSLWITKDSTGAAVSEANQMRIKLSQVYIGPGAIMAGIPQFDQGYNYEKCPVLRWDQAFDMTSKFSYGENTGTRNFVSHGQAISVAEENTHQVNDRGLSSGKMITSKEDPFAPGIFHRDEQDRTFKINAPVIVFSQSSSAFTLGPSASDGWTLRMDAADTVDINGNVVEQSALNSMPQGAVYTPYFEVPTDSSTAAQEALVDLRRSFGTPFRVQSIGQDSGRTTVEINNSIVPYVGEITNMVTTNKSVAGTYCALGAGPGSVNLVLTDMGNEDGLSPPLMLPTITIGFDVDGAWASTTILQPGKGCRTGMYFNTGGYTPPTGVFPTDTFYCDQVDNTSGWRFPAKREAITNGNLTVTIGGVAKSVSMYLVPTQQFSKFSYTAKQKGNSLEYRQFKDPATFHVFPPTLLEGILSTSASVSETDDMRKKVSNGVYRPAGQLDATATFYENQLGAVVNHDTNTAFTIEASNTTFEEVGFTFGAGQVIDPFLTGAWYQESAVYNTLRITSAPFALLGKPFPTNTYMTLTSGTNECHIVTGSIRSQDATYTYIDILCPDVHMATQVKTTKYLSTGAAAIIGVSEIQPTGSTANDLNNWAVGLVDAKWVSDYKNHNTQIDCKWGDMTGSVGLTGTQNFFGNNDVNKSIMASKPLYTNETSAIIDSYDKGGYYFLTHFIGGLTQKDGGGGLILTDENAFNIGLCSYNIAMLPPENYTWRTDYQAPSSENYQQSMCSIGMLWDYYNLYKQRTFTIEKSFCVASDISGLWTRQAHELKGAINPIDNTEYVDSTRTGILQNEFIMPVYGSNNMIGPDGKYVLLDQPGDVWQYSGGLEPGHCVGRNYLNDDCHWMSGSLMAQLPKDVSSNSFYYVFFRTAFTRYRGYDPMASNPASAGVPDFTPLKTVGLQGHKIGNANFPAADGDAVPDPTHPIKKYLDGTETILSYFKAGGTADEPFDRFAYELGTGAGVDPTGAVPPAAPTGNGPATRFGQRGYYPIFYLDRAQASEYDKAKISQYVGSQNLALAFATDISTFTFQFLHSPFTSPFVDGQGGDVACRVFFGNRKDGIYNHEVFGGVVVANYARPDFPLNTFTETEITNNTVFTNFPNGIDPLKSVGRVGNNFMNKLGFTDADIGVQNGKLISGNSQLSYAIVPYTRNISSLSDGENGAETYTLTSYNTKWYGTTGSDIDTSDSILTQIPPPEENAGIESNNQLQVPTIGKSNPILRKYGDYIFYPYSYSSDSSQFQDQSVVRFDNAASTYGAVGGMLLSNTNRGMGLPNTLGSTFLTDDTSVPRTLNPDCELYLAYTVACQSSLKQASLLPIKLNNGYLMILSSLMRETNIYMPNAGFVNAMSIVNFTFLQGDYILSQGEMSFYAKEDFILSEITTDIRDSSFGAPSSLGKNSSVIYSITDYNPKPKIELPTIEQIQDQDMEIARMVQSHQSYLHGQSKTSALQELHSDLYSLGINTLTNQNDVDVIGAIRNQINTHDLANLTPNQRTQFLRTAEGENFLQNVHDAQVIHQQVGIIADTQNDLVGEFGGILGQRRQEQITRDAEREIAIREREIRNRTPLVYFQPNVPIETPPPPDRRRNVQRFIEFRTTKHQDLLGKVFYSKDQRDTADATMTEFADRVKAITQGRRGRPTREQTEKIKEIGAERTEYLKSLRDKMETRRVDEMGTPRDRGIAAIRRGGYTPEDISAMERFQAGMREEERLTDIRQQIQQANVVSPAVAPKIGGDDSGIATMDITRRGSEQ
jgi:hypothetical protein